MSFNPSLQLDLFREQRDAAVVRLEVLADSYERELTRRDDTIRDLKAEVSYLERSLTRVKKACRGKKAAIAVVLELEKAIQRLQSDVANYRSQRDDAYTELWDEKRKASFSDGVATYTNDELLEKKMDFLLGQRYHGDLTRFLEEVTLGQFRTDYCEYRATGVVFYSMDEVADAHGNDIKAICLKYIDLKTLARKEKQAEILSLQRAQSAEAS